MTALTKFLKEDNAATAVEYAVMLAGIIVVALSAISALGGTGGSMFGNIHAEMQGHGM